MLRIPSVVSAKSRELIFGEPILLKTAAKMRSCQECPYG
jgi:hypothetical protein